MVSSYIIKRASDKQWPQHDLTSGQYSGSYDGIDISRHQGRIHWDELGEVKRLKLVFVKATEGTNIQDPWYESNISYAQSIRYLLVPIISCPKHLLPYSLRTFGQCMTRISKTSCLWSMWRMTEPKE